MATSPYRSLSGLSIAGFCLAPLFAVWLLGAAFFSFRSGAPLLLDATALLLPLAASILSAVGWVQIQRLENTRAGLPLAKWGLALSLLCGLSYGSYRLATELALRWQAEEFTDGWLEHLRQSGDETEAYAAFWNVLEPGRRERRFDFNNPDYRAELARNPAKFEEARQALRARYFWRDQGLKGPLPQFFNSDLVQLMHQAGDSAKVHYEGVREWEYLSGAEGGYAFHQVYRIDTPDGTWEVLIPVLGHVIVDGQPRQWHVYQHLIEVKQRSLTARGENVARLRAESRRFATEWTGLLAQGMAREAFLDTLPPGEREQAGNEQRFTAFTEGSLIDVKDLVAEKRLIPQITAEAKAWFGLAARGPASGLLVVGEGMNPTSPWRIVDGELQFLQPIDWRLNSGLHCEGQIVVGTRDPRAVAALGASDSGESGKVPPARPSLGSRWRIVRVDLLLGGQSRKEP